MHLDDLPTPTLLIDLDRLEANVKQMAAKAARLGVDLRPHMKTHKSLDIGKLQLAAGAIGITVSTLYEASVFADAGFDDITWAYPVILNRVDEVVSLAQRVRLGVVVDSTAALGALESTGAPLTVLMKVDCGYHRAGVQPASGVALELARRLDDSSSLRFGGLLTHAGHAYDCADASELLAVARQERDVMVELRTSLDAVGIQVPMVSIGSTPTMSVIDSLDGVDEIRPGNYVFFDLSQVAYGSCVPDACALTVLTSVISQQEGAAHSVIDAGALALSKDAGVGGTERRCYGRIYRDYAAGRLDETLTVDSLSQEHGIVDRPLALGRRLRVVPNHSCLTAAQFDEYIVVRGNEVVDRWPIRRGR